MKTLPRTSPRTVIDDAAEALDAYGETRFAIDPHNASRTDLLFTPLWGPHAGCIYLVDYWSIRPDTCLPSPEIAYSRSKRPTLQALHPDRDVHVVVATNGLIGNGGRRMAESDDLQLIPRISDGAELAAHVAALAGLIY